MAKLSLSEVSKKFHIDRSTIYRAVRNGRLSRSSDGQFDLAEVIRCFGEPEQTSQKIESSKQEGDESTKKLIAHLENEVKKYQEREERLMQQIDRMQTLIELKSVAPATAAPQQDATPTCHSMRQHNKTMIIKRIMNSILQKMWQCHSKKLRHTTPKRYSMPRCKMWQCHNTKNVAYLAEY